MPYYKKGNSSSGGNYDDTEIKNQINLINSKIDNFTIISVKDFGAKGDGITDDSDAILQAIASLPKTNAKLLFPPGIYIHGDGIETGYSYEPDSENSKNPNPTQENINIGKDIRLQFENFNNLIISGYGAEIRSNDNNGECRNNAIMKLTQCKNVTIEGLTFNGRRQERGCTFNDYSVYHSHERGNLHLLACENVIIKDVISINAMMDCICIYGEPAYGYSSHIFIQNCTCEYGYRMGLTLSGTKYVSINGGRYIHNGYEGILPKAAINIESDWDNLTNESIFIENIYCIDNERGIIFSKNLKGCNVTNCYFENSMMNYDNSARFIEIKSCRFKNTNAVGSFHANYYDNLFEFNENYITLNDNLCMCLDYADATNDDETLITYFKGNKIICDIENVPLDFKGELATIRITNTQGNVVFSDNIIKNVLSCQASYPIFLSACKEICNNLFVYDSTVEFSNLFSYIMGLKYDWDYDTMRKSSNNTIIGYSKSQFYDDINTYSQYNGRLTTTVRLIGKQGKLFKINARRVYIKITVFNYECKEISCSYNMINLKKNVTYNDNSFAEFYYDENNSLFVRLTESAEHYMTMDIDIREVYDTHISNEVPILIVSDKDVSTLTKIN